MQTFAMFCKLCISLQNFADNTFALYNAMITERRHIRILELLKEKEFLTYAQLAKKCRVSEATIRRDAIVLETGGAVERVRGGVRQKELRSFSVRTFNESAAILAEEKKRIGRAAAQLVKDGMTLIIDGGTTTGSLAPYIVDKQIDVITNSITVADILADTSEIEVVMTGGYLYRPSKVLLGTPAIRMLRYVNADFTFVSAGGVSLEGIGHSNSLIVDTEKQMIARGKRVALLLDHSKFSTGSVLKVCKWTKITHVITNRVPPDEFIDFFREQDITLIIAE